MISYTIIEKLLSKHMRIVNLSSNLERGREAVNKLVLKRDCVIFVKFSIDTRQEETKISIVTCSDYGSNSVF